MTAGRDPSRTHESPAPLLDQVFEWRGRSVAWTVLGEGPPLVFCHGTPWSSWLWEPYARALADDFTVHLWDMPGYGQSSRHPHHDVHLGVQGEVLSALLDHWGARHTHHAGRGPWRPHVVAHDYGGAVALRASLLHGWRYRSLCLVDVVALRPWGSPFFRLVGEHADTFTRLPEAVHRGAVSSYIAGAAHRDLRPGDLEALVSPWLGEAGQAAFYRQIAQADERWTAQVEPLLARLDTPTRIVWGQEDTWIPVDRAHRLAAAIPGSTVRTIPDAGHLVQLDAPVELATELHRWLTSVP